ncbi:hydroxymyristoyl-ACP dehydratase [Flavobacteriaceae bacterium TK19130]|nr:hydroxymyristoyl-ACP dehydratase [Thermobacterium salinum]
MSQFQNILDTLPYGPSFLFVDGLNSVSEEGVEGYYSFPKHAKYYDDHFKEFPVTPGVLLTECMAQIGLVCLGIHLLKGNIENIQIGLSENEIEFLKPVFPGTKVTVHSKKIYFRFQKLKCACKMYDEAGTLVCKGTISGMIVNQDVDEKK